MQTRQAKKPIKLHDVTLTSYSADTDRNLLNIDNTVIGTMLKLSDH